MNTKQITRLGKITEKLVSDNAPSILTAVAVVGTVGTAYLTAKASFQASKKIEDKKYIKHLHEPGVSMTIEAANRELSKTDTLKLVWSCYIPPVAAGVGTIGAIVLANQIHLRRAAAMAVAYSVSQNQLQEYKDKVVEKFGKTKEQQVRDDIAQDNVNAHPVGKQQVIITGGGEVLCYDKYTGRYFMSSMDTLKKAENDVNFHILHNRRYHLNDFYKRIGLNTVPVGDEVGWNDEFNFEILWSTTIADNGKPCLVIDYQVCGLRRRPSDGPACLKAVGEEV